MPLTQGWISNRWSMLVLRGAAALVFGLLALASPRAAVTAVVFLFAIYAIVDGVTSALFALSSPNPERGPRDLGPPARGGLAGGRGAFHTRGVYLARGAVGICAGIVAFLQPEVTSLAFAVLAGCWAALAGASELALALRLRREGVRRVAGLVVAGMATLALGVALLFAPSLGILAMGGAVAVMAVVSGLSSLSVAARMHDRWTGGLDPLARRSTS